MRFWYKYYLADISQTENGVRTLEIDKNFIEHSKAMDGYDGNIGYESKEEFFKTYLSTKYNSGRLLCYHDFLINNLQKSDKIFSVASGRCANELYLTGNGLDITCSDLEPVQRYRTQQIFGEKYKFIQLNILDSQVPTGFDTVISLSLSYLFDDASLTLFFRNVGANLPVGSSLILDCPGSQPSLSNNFFTDHWLKFEMLAYRYITGKKNFAVVKKHHGYRRTDKGLISIANDAGFALRVQKNYSTLNEFRRSIIFNKIVREGSTLAEYIKPLANIMPGVRIYAFEKIS